MNKWNGFSLIEVLVTMAIAAIVLSIGVPSFQSYIQNNRQTTAINELATVLQLARNSAISRRVRVTVCKSSDGAACQTGTGSDWSQGWMVFTNPNSNTALGAGDTLLRVHTALPGNTTFIGNGSTVVDQVSFKPQGLVDGSIGTITLCDSRGADHASALIISFGGQVRQATDTNKSGTVDNGTPNTTGVDVTCPS